MGSVEDFHGKHGPEMVIHNGLVYFPDGATRDNSEGCRLMPPSEDPRERARCVLIFHKVTYELAAAKFRKNKERALALIEGTYEGIRENHIDHEAMAADLAKERKRVIALEKAWKTAEKLAAPPGERQSIRDLKKMMVRESDKRTALAESVKKLTIKEDVHEGDPDVCR